MATASTTKSAPPDAKSAPRNTILEGDALATLRGLPSRSVQCVITSPPYYGLRDYGTPGQYGLEPTLEGYLDRMVAVFDEVFRVLRPDGVCWLNIGDSYNAYNGNAGLGGPVGLTQSIARPRLPSGYGRVNKALKPKDLMLVPFRLALALQAAGWYVRSDIIWHKPAPMPESVTDRPTRAHEYIFLLTRSERYHFDAAAIREPAKDADRAERISAPSNWSMADGAHGTIHPLVRGRRADKQRGHSRRHAGFNDRWDAMTHAEQMAHGCNKRDVWTVAAANFPEAHYATFPPALIEPMILAGSRPGDLILDTFMGSGTVGVVARQLGRDYLGIELSHEYAEMARRRIAEEGRPVVLKRKQRHEMRQAGVTQASLLDVV